MLANTKTLEDAKAVKAYLHPTRMKILSSVARNPKTISAVGREFGEHPANLTHHFRRLKSAGLIHLVEERSAGRNIEKLYMAAAPSFEVRPEKRALKGARSRVLRILQEDLHAGITQLDEENLPVIGLISNVRIDTKRFDEFTKRLKDLIANFQKFESSEGHAYSLNLSLYPRK